MHSEARRQSGKEGRTVRHTRVAVITFFCLVVLMLNHDDTASVLEKLTHLDRSTQSPEVYDGPADEIQQVPVKQGRSELGGTSWQLVKFQGGNDETLTPDDKAKYTIAFGTDGRVTARIDCNRGSGTWKSSGPNQIQFSPLALTRAMCPPGSLHDQIAKNWSAVRSYIIKEGHLFLSLMADAGIYEYEPIGETNPPAAKSPVSSTGPINYDCTQAAGGGDSLSATFYQTTPAMVLVERGGQTRPAFLVRAASGTKYQGSDLTFWESKGEALVTWSGAELRCKRR